MSKNKYPTLTEIRASHGPKIEYERYLFASRFIFRPPSFPAIWFLIRLGVSSEATSWLSGAAALAGYVCLLWPAGPLLWPGITLLMLFNFFDCLDGGIARVMATRNPYGRFLDSMMWWVDMLFWMVLGVTVWRLPDLRVLGDAYGSGTWIAAGALSAFFTAYSAYLENTFDQVLRPHWENLLRQRGIRSTPTPIEGKSGSEVFLRVLFHNLRVRETHYLLLALACAFRSADLLLAAYLTLNAAFAVSILIIYCRRGRQVYAAGLGRNKEDV